jgi:hypothetical protein
MFYCQSMGHCLKPSENPAAEGHISCVYAHGTRLAKLLVRRQSYFIDFLKMQSGSIKAGVFTTLKSLI